MRLDKWLWAARFFKTRSMAAEAVEGGKVHLNGSRTKPAHRLRAGDRLRITRGVEMFDVEVLGLNAQRRPGSEAQALYQESQESLAKRTADAEMRRLAWASAPVAEQRPDKRGRRLIRRFTGKA